MMYPNQQPAPMQRQANQMARQGRYGDSMLVHMNPAEVQGIAALSPTGQLTRNPMTGQPEAFLPFLAPLIGSMAGKAFLGKTVGSALAGAIGSGLATTAVTGDIKKGLMSGITGFGLGKALGAASDALNPEISGTASALGEAQKTAAEASADLAKAGIAGGSQPFTPAQIGEFTAAKTAADAATQNVTDLTQNLANLRGEQTITDSLTAPFRQPGAFGKALMDPLTLTAIGTGEGQRAQMEAEESIMDRNRRFEEERQAELDRAYATRDAAIGLAQSRYRAGGITSINPQNYQRSLQGFDNLVNGTNNYSRGGELENEAVSSAVEAAVNAASRFGPGAIPGSSVIPGGAGAAARQAALRGPVKSAAELAQEYGADFRPGFGGEINYFKNERPKVDVPGTGASGSAAGPVAAPVQSPLPGAGGTVATPAESDFGVFGSANPQAGGRGGAPMGDFAGGSVPLDNTFVSEVLQNPNEPGMLIGGMEGLGGAGPESLRGMATPLSTTSPDVGVPNVMRDPVAMGIPAPPPSPMAPPMPDMKQSILDDFISERGDPSLGRSDTRRRPRPSIPGLQEGGATDMPDRSMTPTMESNGQMIIERAVEAISGKLTEDEAEAAINRFIDEFGSETFAMLRDRVLKDIVPGAQTEGEITGMGGGMDDMIPGMIGEQQPVAVSPGEYIVPADVVSGIGDGSTDAGVDELNGMLDRVRMERTGTTIQPDPMRSGGILPA